MKLDKIHSVIEKAKRKSIKCLDLQGFHLSIIPQHVFGYSHLKSVLFQNNRLTFLPEEIGTLVRLRHVNLAKNKLDELPESFKSLENITRLSLKDNDFVEFPRQLLKLTKLSKLNLSGNQLKTLPTNIGFFQNLRYLDLSNNDLDNLPSSIGKLSKLETLNISNNNLQTLPSSIGDLKNLKRLIANSNQIKSLPNELENLTKLFVFELNGNPIGVPPLEIKKQGILQIINYYISLGDEITLNEAKLLVIGQGDVGKTFLMKRLVHDKVNLEEESTEGIEIDKWLIDTLENNHFRINFWDFGGQEIYHSTHQFFLTKRSLYLLVWEARKDDDLISFDYWLNVLKLLSDSSSVIIVQNKIDVRIKHIDEASLKEAFPNIIGFHKVSAIERTGIPELIKTIKREIVNLEHVGDVLPKVWLEIRKKLEGLDLNYISYSRYLEICEEFGMNDKRSAFLSQYFHDLGVFLHFDDNDILKELVFLKPDWATNAVYKVIDTREVRDNYGKFNFSELKIIWEDYPRDKFIPLLELMKKFEICFQISNTQTYIVPELLRVEKVKYNWSTSDNLKYEYHYEFMPAGIITRFIVRIHDLINEDEYWKNGVVIKRENTLAQIINYPFQRKIKIWVDGDEKPGLLQIIRREIDFIHNSLNNPAVKEMIPCNCPTCLNSDTPFLHNYEALKKAKGKNIKEVLCQKSFNNIEINQLIGGVEYIIKNEQTINVLGDFIQNKSSTMKIKKIVNKEGSQANFADKIDKVVFEEKLGIGKMEFEQFLQAVRKMPQEKQEELETQYEVITIEEDTNEKKGLIEKTQKFLVDNGIPTAQSFSGTVIFELLRMIFGG